MKAAERGGDNPHTDGPSVKGARSRSAVAPLPSLCRKCNTIPAAEGMPYCEACESRILDRMIEGLLGDIQTRSTPRRNTFRP